MKQNDISENLKQWNRLDRYSQWMYHTYMQYIGKKVLDIGAGVGNLTQFLQDRCECVIAIDIFDKQIEMMKIRFRNNKNFDAFIFNFMEDDLAELQRHGFDTIICVNVLEHLENDMEAVMRMKEIVQPGGKIIILVPAWGRLYSHLDKNVGHHRRYDRGDLKKIANKCKLKIVDNKYYNFFGIIPYYLKGKFAKDKGGSFSTDLNNANSKIYNLVTGILEPLERHVKPKFGLSEIIVLEK